MKFAGLFLLLLLLVHHSFAGEPFFVAAADGIYRGELDGVSGKLGPLALACAVKSPNFLALSPDGKSLYATLDKTVAAFAIGKDGALMALNEEPSGGDGPCYVTVDRTGQDVLVANYGGGSIACLQRKADGSLGEQTSFHGFVSSGPDQSRQKGAHAHAIYTDPENKFVYTCDLGGDDVWIHKFDAALGKLLHADPMLAKVPPGSGPRHLAFGSGGKFVYVANEMGHSVTTFARDAASGALTAVKTVSTLSPETSPQGVTIAEIACHPSGKWLYVSNRGCETISAFFLAADGTPTLIQSLPSPAKFPRNFALDPTGHWMIVAGQKDTRLAVLKIGHATGQLSPTGQTAPVNAAMCVLFAPESK